MHRMADKTRDNLRFLDDQSRDILLHPPGQSRWRRSGWTYVPPCAPPPGIDRAMLDDGHPMIDHDPICPGATQTDARG
jgi:hypothetical protein